MDLKEFQIHNYSGQRLPRFRSLERLLVYFIGREWLSGFPAQDAGGQLDLSPLRDTKGLKFVSLESAVFNLPKGLEDLKELKITLRDDRELGILATYPNLKDLTLRGSTITEFGPLVRCKALRSLSIENAKITDISAVKELPRLQDLNISGNPVTDITPLSYIKGLRDIDASSTAITSLEGWNPRAWLGLLKLNKTKVSDLRPLHGTGVYEHWVADTSLASLEGISAPEDDEKDPADEFLN